MQLLPMASSPDGLISARYAVISTGGGGDIAGIDCMDNEESEVAKGERALSTDDDDDDDREVSPLLGAVPALRAPLTHCYKTPSLPLAHPCTGQALRTAPISGCHYPMGHG